jgi:crossover junction endodeoxyribonuclease RuvC
MIILGIDPGLATLGYGVIEKDERGNFRALDCGVVTTPKEEGLPVRLAMLEEGLKKILDTYHPDEVAMEELFFSKNITTGIAVAEARGVVLLVAALNDLPVYEYSPNQIKMSLAGYGAATKTQMEEMVRVHLGLEKKPKPDDAADALAVAITCGFLYQNGPDDKYKFSNSRR